MNNNNDNNIVTQEQKFSSPKDNPHCPPKTLNFNVGTIPEELKELNRWVGWRWEWKGDKWSKPPVDIHNLRSHADSTAPGTWSSFTHAVRWARDDFAKLAGIGFVLGDGYCGTDLDNCLSLEEGIAPWAQEIINQLDTYAEASPTGTGIKLLCKGKLPGHGRKTKVGTGELEMYDCGRYFTITGRCINDKPIEDRQKEVAALYKTHFPKPAETTAPLVPVQPTEEDAVVLGRASNASNGAKFVRLYSGDMSGYVHDDGSPDHSGADQALVNLLYFWTGGNREQTERLFSSSKLVREKWTDRPYYRNRTIDNAAKVIAPYLSPATSYPSDWDSRIDQLFAGKVKPEDNQETEQPQEDNKPTTKHIYSIKELMDFPELHWQIHNHFAEQSHVILFGAPGSYKSFVAADWMMCVATGKPYLDLHTVQPGAVMYIVGEGRGLFKRRLAAWLSYYGREIPENVGLAVVPYNLCHPSQGLTVMEHINQDMPILPSMVVIDTLNKNFVGDENSPKDMSAYLANVDLIRQKLNCTVVTVHHSGWGIKGDRKRIRGHSSLLGSCDTAIMSENGHITCEKQKDYEEFGHYLLKPYSVAGSLVMRVANESAATFEGLEEKEKEFLRIVWLNCGKQSMKRKDLAELCPQSQATVYRYCDKLRDEGIFLTDDDGRYRINPVHIGSLIV